MEVDTLGVPETEGSPGGFPAIQLCFAGYLFISLIPAST